MTLNLLVVSPKHVYQCSDFRLTYKGGVQTDHEAQKVVAISSRNWSALVQFTGVAKTRTGFDTSDWLAGLAKGNFKPNVPISWLINQLLSWTLANFRASETAISRAFRMLARIFLRFWARPGPIKYPLAPRILGHFAHLPVRNWPKSS
jgi:hypothetical protein